MRRPGKPLAAQFQSMHPKYIVPSLRCDALSTRRSNEIFIDSDQASYTLCCVARHVYVPVSQNMLTHPWVARATCGYGLASEGFGTRGSGAARAGPGVTWAILHRVKSPTPNVSGRRLLSNTIDFPSPKTSVGSTHVGDLSVTIT
jgi:hypothetical protein